MHFYFSCSLFNELNIRRSPFTTGCVSEQNQKQVVRMANTSKEKDFELKDSVKNFVRKHREELLMSKAEVARKAGLSALTIDRIEAGMNCRMDTKRKIILALGLKLSDKDKVFPESETAEAPK